MYKQYFLTHPLIIRLHISTHIARPGSITHSSLITITITTEIKKYKYNILKLQI